MIPSPYFIQPTNRTKRIKITVYCDGSFSVTAPKNTSKEIIKKFITQKASWIRDKIEYFRKKGFKKYIPVNRKLKIEEKIKEKNQYIFYKAKALEIAKNKVEEFNKLYNFKYNKITIKNQKTRWGSCSKSGNLNFSYKLTLLPDHLASYLIVHEICHLGEFNHSKDFWALVEKTIPDYKKCRLELKNFKFKN